MFTEFVQGKTIICIDASNIYHAQKSLGWNVDFRKLMDLLRSELDVFGIYYYMAYDPNNNKQKKFIDLKKFKSELKLEK